MRNYLKMVTLSFYSKKAESKILKQKLWRREDIDVSTSREKHTNLKEEILNIAQSMFRDYGYDGTTFQKIADQLGITKGAITYHFKNKHLIMAHFFDLYFHPVSFA